MLGAICPVGIYTVEAGTVHVKLALHQNGEILLRLQVEGVRDDIMALADKMAEAIGNLSESDVAGTRKSIIK